MIIKAHQIALIKSLIVGLILIVSCSQHSKENRIDEPFEVNSNKLKLIPTEGKWYFNNVPFTGIAVSYHSNETMASRVSYVDGKKEGSAIWWFESGRRQKSSFYTVNRLHGKSITWWPTGLKSSESYFEYGVLEGVQKRWHANGQLARKTQLANGREEGLQQAWLANGKIYVNYQAKNGRIFGLKKSVLCYELENEIVQN